MNQVTQRTAARAEESASAAQELSQQSQSLAGVARQLNELSGTCPDDQSAPRPKSSPAKSGDSSHHPPSKSHALVLAATP